MQIFTKGNDIETTLEVFKDPAMKIPEELFKYDIEMLLYTQTGAKEPIYVSTNRGTISSDIFTVVNSNTLQVVLRKSLFRRMRIGEVTLEVRIVNKSDKLSSVILSNSFLLADSEFDNLQL